jgi:hypothetical protein
MPSESQRRCELWSPVESVGSLATLGFDELGKERDAFGFGEAVDRSSLSLDAETRSLCLSVETR